MLQAKIAEIINNEMNFTNGWRISDNEYEQLCLKVADLIKQAIEQNTKVNPVICKYCGDEIIDFDCPNYNREFERLN